MHVRVVCETNVASGANLPVLALLLLYNPKGCSEYSGTQNEEGELA